MLCKRSTCTSLWVGSKIEEHQGAVLSFFHSTVGWVQGSSVLCLLRLEAGSVAQTRVLSVLVLKEQTCQLVGFHSVAVIKNSDWKQSGRKGII